MTNVRTASSPAPPRQVPGVWDGVLWALRRGGEGGGVSRPRLAWRAVTAALAHGHALRRWMIVVFELRARGIVDDMEGEYLRAVRPSVHRQTDPSTRVMQLIDHVDWLETAFCPVALERLAAGAPVVLAELPAPRGFDFIRLQLQRAGVQSPEGELLLTLTLQRSADVQHRALPAEVAALAFSRFRLEGAGCLAIGGVRGQRHPVQRLSPVEVDQALHGWKPAVFMVRVMQELARAWGQTLIGLRPGAHRLHGWSYRFSRRHRAAARRIDASYQALWDHFEATPGAPGWVVLPLQSDEKLAATALSPERRERQARRADYWIRARKLLRTQLRELLLRPTREQRQSGATQATTEPPPQDWDALDPEWPQADPVPSRVLETGPASLD